MRMFSDVGRFDEGLLAVKGLLVQVSFYYSLFFWRKGFS